MFIIAYFIGSSLSSRSFCDILLSAGSIPPLISPLDSLKSLREMRVLLFRSTSPSGSNGTLFFFLHIAAKNPTTMINPTKTKNVILTMIEIY